jgi:RNA polymerase sigma-70 factor (ECF subfamily)
VDALASEAQASPTPEVPRLTEHLFRHEAGKLVSVLTGIFGIDRLQMAEDVVQEALVRALQTWPYDGIPKNPPAWLMQTAKHLALDIVRREKSFHEKEPAIIAFVERTPADAGADEAIFFEDEIKDARLRLLFVCCHPLIAEDSQVALALKTLCGFNTIEISKAFLTTEATIAKRLTRAKQRVRDFGIPFEIPSGEDVSPRLTGVLQTLYLLFNEGYKASGGDRLVREELCYEAIRLTMFLVEHPAGNQPTTHALLALMLLNAARLETRVDPEGNLVRLDEQERSKWNQEMIGRGIFHLGQSAAGDELGEYHLQAGIAACHCAARDYQSTDWRQILALYDRLVEIDGSPVVALNRAIAVANVHGPAAGIEAVQTIRDRRKLESYYLLYAVLGDFEWRLGRLGVATDFFRTALKLADTKSEQAFLERRRVSLDPYRAHVHSQRRIDFRHFTKTDHTLLQASQSNEQNRAPFGRSCSSAAIALRECRDSQVRGCIIETYSRITVDDRTAGQGMDIHANHVTIAQIIVNNAFMGMKAMHGSRNVITANGLPL